MTVALITGFGAFGDETTNVSGSLAASLDGRRLDDVRCVGCVLPVAGERVGATLLAAVEQAQPDILIVTGVAPGRAAPALERVAINVRDFPLADVDGACPVDEPVVTGGPEAYFSTLPIKAVLAAWRRAGIPGYVSNTAGTYVCNQTFYLARHITAASGIRCGLVHLPVDPPRAAAEAFPPPSLPIDILERSVACAVTVTAAHQGEDVVLGAGALS